MDIQKSTAEKYIYITKTSATRDDEISFLNRNPTVGMYPLTQEGGDPLLEKYGIPVGLVYEKKPRQQTGGSSSFIKKERQDNYLEDDLYEQLLEKVTR
jgi:hypothetical protein